MQLSYEHCPPISDPRCRLPVGDAPLDPPALWLREIRVVQGSIIFAGAPNLLLIARGAVPLIIVLQLHAAHCISKGAVQVRIVLTRRWSLLRALISGRAGGLLLLDLCPTYDSSSLHSN